MRRNYALDRAKLAKRVGPIGAFIVDALHKKAHGILPIPHVPSNGIQPSKCPTTCANKQRISADTRGISSSKREAPVLRDCLAWLHKKGIFAYRQNTGTVWIGGQPVSFGYPGAGDITGILPDGRRLEVECKGATGKQSEKQKKFQEKIEQNGGVYLLVRSVAELEEKWQ